MNTAYALRLRMSRTADMRSAEAFYASRLYTCGVPILLSDTALAASCAAIGPVLRALFWRRWSMMATPTASPVTLTVVRSELRARAASAQGQLRCSCNYGCRANTCVGRGNFRGTGGPLEQPLER